jgi:hypothetical protein
MFLVSQARAFVTVNSSRHVVTSEVSLMKNFIHESKKSQNSQSKEKI